MKLDCTWAGLFILALRGLVSATEVPPILSYQGDLRVAGTNYSGIAQFKFALVDSTGSQTYWSHDGSGSGGGPPASAVTLTVSNGLFQVLLGDTTIPHMTSPIPANIFSNTDVRLRIWCSEGGASFQQLAPSQRLTSAAYALRSDTADVAMSLAAGVATNTGTVTRVDTGQGLIGGPITSTGMVAIGNSSVVNTMLQNSNLRVVAGSGLTGGGLVPLGGSTTVSLNLNHDASLLGNGATTNLGLNPANANTWTATQAFSRTIQGNISGSASSFTGQLEGDVNGTQGATLITNLSISKISGLFKWQTVAGASQQLLVNTGYILTNQSLVTLTLPASPIPGEVVRLSAPGAGGWKLTQNPNQSVLAGNFESLQIGVSWLAHGPSTNWSALASSTDGIRLVAAVSGGFLYTSSDSGSTWTPRGISTNWFAVASSADGVNLAATVKGGCIYTSTDAGVTWSPRSFAANWYGIASSADGSKLVAVVNGGNIYTSTNSGATWNGRQGPAGWYAVASSSDGTHLAAGGDGNPIYISTDSGATWNARGPGGNWDAIACSKAGTKLAATSRNGPIYTSTDSGNTWTARSTARTWYSVASSADGTRLVAVVNGGQIYTSLDSGLNWTAQSSNRSWQAVTCSAEGNLLAAAVNKGQIYVSPPPQVSPATTTTPGTTGYLLGEQGSALELQYIGSSQFIPLSSAGRIEAF